MRKFLSVKAGATFFQETPNDTFAVRKYCIEIIRKIKPGIYTVLSLSCLGEEECILFANWGNYFDRLTNPKAQLPQLEKCCPKLYSFIADEDKDGVTMTDLYSPEDGKTYHGFGLNVRIPKGRPLILCLDEDLIHSAIRLSNKILAAHNELVTNPPFPAWRKDLSEIWD